MALFYRGGGLQDATVAAQAPPQQESFPTIWGCFVLRQTRCAGGLMMLFYP